MLCLIIYNNHDIITASLAVYPKEKVMNSATGVEIGIDSTLMPPTVGGETYSYFDDGRSVSAELRVAQEDDLPLGEDSLMFIALVAVSLALAWLTINAGGVVPFSIVQW